MGGARGYSNTVTNHIEALYKFTKFTNRSTKGEKERLSFFVRTVGRLESKQTLIYEERLKYER